VSHALPSLTRPRNSPLDSPATSHPPRAISTEHGRYRLDDGGLSARDETRRGILHTVRQSIAERTEVLSFELADRNDQADDKTDRNRTKPKGERILRHKIFSLLFGRVADCLTHHARPSSSRRCRDDDALMTRDPTIPRMGPDALEIDDASIGKAGDSSSETIATQFDGYAS